MHDEIPRVYVDVTRTATRGYHTGIQKTVRGLYRALRALGEREGFVVVPVATTGRGPVVLRGLAFHPYESGRDDERRGRGVAQGTFDAARRLVARARARLAGREGRGAGVRVLQSALDAAIRLGRSTFAPQLLLRPPVRFRPQDVYLLPDSSWLAEPWAGVERARAAGAGVASLWYDLIPVLHPEHFDPPAVQAFEAYLTRILAEADLVVAISRTVRLEIEDFAQGARLTPPRLAHAWPGVEVAEPTRRPRPELADVLAGPTVLMVATLEPRKGHALLLDAMEVVWRAGHDVNCLLVGRVGWNVDALVERLRTHPERGRRLLHLADASDAEVAFAYANARVTAYPSMAEGLGLPILEAELSGCPSVCTDIPVFREIAGPATTLFSPRTSERLAEALIAELSGPAPDREAISDFRRGLGFDVFAAQVLSAMRDAGLLPTASGAKSTFARGEAPEPGPAAATKN
ncbi:glycosyltransferase family 4 protein [Salinarimonas ramus]|uniref:Glycosyl transferase family 1 domain-containing protein n=1 Tax=Salinarimonas ramus TaxID=690164 RepID=A0A917QEU7_9HYPH|nr:glycosyltransferase family 1 protein [Salinarimonas ramus]GGK47101.1 hypothetical protein GCM10011322_37690 [Salinarimonas ramus]